jgi:hypothetical protein
MGLSPFDAKKEERPAAFFVPSNVFRKWQKREQSL